MATMDEKSTLEDLIQAFGSLDKFGTACGYEKNPGIRASEVRQRGLLPVERWPGVIAEAKALRIRGVTHEFLTNLYIRARQASAAK